MPEKTHDTAVVMIPPPEAWEPIQAIRRAYDRQFRRWMPHVTLLYPFRPREEFSLLIPLLSDACRGIEPFEIELAQFRWFEHGGGSFTLWLAPEPAEKLRGLQAALQAVVPDCDDVSRHEAGFAPHLSVGQARDRHEVQRLAAELQASWQPIRFTATGVSLIWRGEPPDDVFRPAAALLLGAP